MNITTYRLSLETDRDIPSFRRLSWERIEVSLADVFREGIHPHSAVVKSQGRDHTEASTAILAALNDEGTYIPDLKAHGLGCELTGMNGGYHAYHSSTTELDRLFEEVAQSVYFADDLTYEELVEIALTRLRRIWNHRMAREFVQAVGRDFAGIRDFLKSKNPDIRLVGYDSLNDYDLTSFLRVDDFLTEDSLLVSHGIRSHNFRRVSAVNEITDDCGRLKLTTSIKRCAADWSFKPGHWEPLVTFHCRVDGARVVWKPDLKADPKQRDQAAAIAAANGTGSSRYVFSTTVRQMTDALSADRFRLRFPDLNYGSRESESLANAKLCPSSLVCFGETSGLRSRLSNEKLKEVLRNFGKKLTGKKEDLLRRIAETIAAEYRAHEAELDRYFSAHRYVRLAAQPRAMSSFPVLENHGLRGPIITLYCLRHLRGNVILEASHENDSVTLEDQAEAWLDRKVTLNGSFVPVG